MAAALTAMLPGLMDQASQSPLGVNNLLNMGAYELYGRQMEETRFQRQLDMQTRAFNQMNTSQTNAFQNSTANLDSNQNFARAMQDRQFIHSNTQASMTFENAKDLQSMKTKGNLMNTAAQGGISMMNSGFNLLGNYLNYSYNTKLQDQAFQNQKSLFNTQADRMTSEFEKGGMPGWAAFSGGQLSSAVPHSTQVLSGINTRTSRLPGNQTQFYSQTGSQTALGLGVVNVG